MRLTNCITINMARLWESMALLQKQQNDVCPDPIWKPVTAMASAEPPSRAPHGGAAREAGAEFNVFEGN